MASKHLRVLLPLASVAALTLSVSAPALAQTQWGEAKNIHVGGDGGMDYLTVEPSTHRLFIPRSTHTQIVDANSGKILGDVPGQKTAHGVAIVPALNRGFITDGGGEGAIIIFDLKSYAVLGKLASAPDSDGIIYDAKLKKIVFVSGDKGLLMTFSPDIDPVHGKIDAPIDLGGAPEYLASDENGKVFVNLMDKNVVAVVDMKARKVVARWPVAPGGAPVGLAIDRAKHRLYIGCRKPQQLVEMSTEDGKVLGAVPIGAGVDATKFEAGQAFASCGDGNLVVAGDVNGKFAIEQTVKTPQRAKTMDIDPTGHKIYLPTAEYEAAAPGTRPKAKPDSFMVVEVDKK